MKNKIIHPAVPSILLFLSVSLACGLVQPAPTGMPQLTSTSSPSPTATQTRRPSPTPRPTRTPDVAATAHVKDLAAEVRSHFEDGYLTTTEGRLREFDEFEEEWAQLGWYSSWVFNETASDFFMAAHFKWSSAYRNADISGCGFIFALQDNESRDHYAVFLDRSQIYFVETGYYYQPFKPTRGTGRVNFANPADQPVEADFTLIVRDAYAYVLVDEELVGEYTLSRSRDLDGRLGLALLSGTNKDFGTRCEVSNLHLWTPKE
jgi:hypothetical protein